MVFTKQNEKVRAGILVFLFAVAFAASGCGGKGDVTGSVTYQGKKVTTGTVTLIGSDGIAYHAVISDGSYTVRDVPSGPAKVAVHSPGPQGGMALSKEGASRLVNPDMGLKQGLGESDRTPPRSPDKKSETPSPAAKNWFPIPEHLADPDQSRITFDVQRGPNTFDIPLDKVP